MSQERKRDRSRSPIGRGGSRRRRDSGGHGREGGSDRMVYISNVPYTVRWMELKDLVREKAGEVNFVEMLETGDGKSKGCAVVEFKTKEDAKKCVDTMHRMTIGDRHIVVKEIRDPERFFRKVKEDTGMDFLGRGTLLANLGDRPKNRSFAPSSGGPQNFETYGLSPQFLAQLGIECPLCNRVFIANLDFKVGSLKLHETFSLAGTVLSVDLQMDKEGKSKGLAVVEFSHPIEAVQAISMFNSQTLYDRKMTVKMDRFEKAVDDRRPGELPLGLRSVGPGLGEGGAPLTNIAQTVAAYNPMANSNMVAMAPVVDGNMSSMMGPSSGVQNPQMVSGGGYGNYGSSSAITNGNSMSGGGSMSMMGNGSSMNQMGMSGGGGMQMGQSGNLAPTPTPGGLNQANRFSQSTVDSSRSYNASVATQSLGGSSMGSYEASLMGSNANVASMGGGGGYGGMSVKSEYDSQGMMGGGAVGDRLMSDRNMMGGVTSQPSYDRYANPSSAASAPVRGPNTGGSMGGMMGSGRDGYQTQMQPQMQPQQQQQQRNMSPMGSMTPVGNSLLVRNLPRDYTWQLLKDRLRNFAAEHVDMIAPGIGKVRFTTARDADNAMRSLNGLMVEQRALAVEYCA